MTAFLLAIVCTFAFKSNVGVSPVSYGVPGQCFLTGTTDQSSCNVHNTGAQSTVLDGYALAWSQQPPNIPCTVPMRQFVP